jgi:hypothetical protein
MRGRRCCIINDGAFLFKQPENVNVKNVSAVIGSLAVAREVTDGPAACLAFDGEGGGEGAGEESDCCEEGSLEVHGEDEWFFGGSLRFC